MAIRSTWGLVREVDGYQVRVVFTMGGLESACPRREYDLRTEQDAYNDLLVGNFTDSYHNISHKVGLL